MRYSRMNIRCKCGEEWVFPLPFTTYEEFILREHMKLHPNRDADYAVRSILGDISAEADIEILEQLYEVVDDREE